jgi:hypothetical protein
MSKLLEFTNFLRDRRVAADDLAHFAEIIETAAHADGWVGYRMKPLCPADKISQRCKVLMQYTWHCRDYVKKILEEHGVAEPGRIVNDYIKVSQEIQVISYLANEYKHAGTDASQRWAVELAPRFGKPYVHGVFLSFPHRLKPTFIMWGDSLPEFEFVGRAGVDDLTFQFTDFTWTFSCVIEDKDGKPLGDAAGLCESAFQTWLKVLADKGIDTGNQSTRSPEI